MERTSPKWKYGTEINVSKPQRAVNTVFLHCSASDSESHDDISVMKRWHMVDNGWPRVGYHFFINKNGDIQEGCPIEKNPIAQKGHNEGSIAICVHGLVKSKFTKKQMESVNKLCRAIVGSYEKKIRIRGHKEVSNKSCPVFDYKTTLGLNASGYFQGAGDVGGGAPSGQIVAIKATPVGASKKLQAIKLMHTGPQVMALQKILGTLGYACSADGNFGKKTQMKVREFQRNSKLQPDGVVGSKSINAMFSCKKVCLKKVNKGTDVLVLQLLLSAYGKPVMFDGVFGLGTEKALASQQRLMGIKPDGVFGDKSREIMLV